MEQKVKLLEKSPYMWPIYPYNSKYRRMVLEGHLLFYVIDEAMKKVMIYRVLYGKRDVEKHIN
jgi:plasmid stabilization system protein ParE